MGDKIFYKIYDRKIQNNICITLQKLVGFLKKSARQKNQNQNIWRIENYKVWQIGNLKIVSKFRKWKLKSLADLESENCLGNLEMKTKKFDRYLEIWKFVEI